jgi:hypothetical protein
MTGDLSACKSKRTLIQLLTVNSVFAGSASVLGVSFSRHRQYSSQPRRCHAHVFGIHLRSVHFQEV